MKASNRLLIAGALAFTQFISFAGHAAVELAIVQNEAYKAIIDCTTRLPIVVTYRVDFDNGNEPRFPRYIADDYLLTSQPDCHPDIKTHRYKTYQSVATASGLSEKYDVGHLAMANHLDQSSVTIKLANQWTNLAPQIAEFNRSGGAWYASELLIECQRDIEPLIVLAGVIDLDGGDTTFQTTFKQPTPEFWWRVVYFTQTNKYAAWLIPNSADSLEPGFISGAYDIDLKTLAKHILISIPEIESLITQNTTRASQEMLRTTSAGGKLNCRGKTTHIS